MKSPMTPEEKLNEAVALLNEVENELYLFAVTCYAPTHLKVRTFLGMKPPTDAQLKQARQ